RHIERWESVVRAVTAAVPTGFKVHDGTFPPDLAYGLQVTAPPLPDRPTERHLLVYVSYTVPYYAYYEQHARRVDGLIEREPIRDQVSPVFEPVLPMIERAIVAHYGYSRMSPSWRICRCPTAMWTVPKVMWRRVSTRCSPSGAGRVGVLLTFADPGSLADRAASTRPCAPGVPGARRWANEAISLAVMGGMDGLWGSRYRQRWQLWFEETHMDWPCSAGHPRDGCLPEPEVKRLGQALWTEVADRLIAAWEEVHS
ncbi:MAG: hypothetical protein AAGC55_11150, partial [Myxococcota bacterium]